MTAVIVQNRATYDQIRISACDLFCRKGYKGVSMRSLATAVGISAGSLYNHIESKQALLDDLISEYELDLLEVFKSSIISRAKNPLQMVAVLWEQVEKYVTQNNKLARLARAESCNLTTAQMERVLVIRGSRVQVIHRLLTLMPEVGLSDVGLHATAEELCALLDCNTNFIMDADVPANDFVRRQLRVLATLLMIKRD